MLKVNSFLGCYRLEFGGLVIAWISLLANVLSLLLLVSLIGGFSYMDCDDLEKILQKKSEENWDEEFKETFENLCRHSRGGVIIGLIVSALIVSGFVYIAYICIKGIKKRDHVLVRPMLILFGIYTAINFLGMLSLTANGFVMGILEGGFNCYIFVILYSLFYKFRAEFQAGGQSQYQLT